MSFIDAKRWVSQQAIGGLMALAVFLTSPAAVAVVPDLPRLGASAMVYEGSFMVPLQDRQGVDMTFGGYALGIDPVRQGLYFGCHDYLQQLAEVSLPALGAMATVLQDCTDVTQGRLPQVDDYLPRLGGSLWHGGRLIVSAFGDYDADNSQTHSHFAAAPDFADASGLLGPVRVGDRAGFVAGYMTAIPAEWREAFGGPALDGQCCINIISRSSAGPAASVFDPADLGVVEPVPARMLLGYPLEHALAEPASQNPWFNNTTRIVGLAFPPGSRSLLFIGRHGTGPYCYDTAEVCGDPADPYKGPHAWPYIHQVWAYDALDLLKVQRGEAQPWDLRPYAVWHLTEMDQSQAATVSGATYDPASGRLYVTEVFGEEADGHRVHVYRISPPANNRVTASVTAANKTYDGTTAATLTACTLTGVTAGDVVTCSASAASFSDANAGANKTVTATGITLAGAQAGKYTLTSTTATTTASIAKASATVTLGTLNRTYTGTPLSPTATTSPAGLTVSFTGAPQTNAGTYPVTATITNTNYSGTASGTFVIAKATQPALNLTATPTTIASGGPGSTLAVTGGIGGTVTYAATPSAGVTCTLSGKTLSATGTAGSCSVKANHPGNGNYQPVTSNTVTISVTPPVNVAPVAVNDAFTLLVNGTNPVTVAAPGILANDTDANRDSLKVAGITPRSITLASSGGRVMLQANGSFTYTPPSASFSGMRTFTYQVTDGKLASNTATVTLTITRRPTATADTTVTALNTAKVISVLANDVAIAPASLNPASLVITSAPANGSAKANANGTITYTPTTGFAGTNSFSYTVKDSLGTASNPAPVTVHVPQARNDSYSVTANTSTSQTGTAASVGLNDVPNISGRTFTRLGNPIRTSGSGTGTLTITSFNSSTGAFSYRLSGTQANKRGTFQFSYRMSLGGVNTAPATVTIGVR